MPEVAAGIREAKAVETAVRKAVPEYDHVGRVHTSGNETEPEYEDGAAHGA